MNDVDDLIKQTCLDQVLMHYSKPVPNKPSGEHRMACVFNAACHESQYGNLTVRLDDSAHRIFCHSCGVRGNLLTLVHGLEHHQPPEGGRLRGAEFKAAVEVLRQIAGGKVKRAVAQSMPVETQLVATKPLTNIPLVRHEKEAARGLADLFNDFVVDLSAMSPEAAQYLRRRSWLTPELLQKWNVGWIPGSGRSLFRKTYLTYTHRNEVNEVVSYSGRDLSFESKWQKWLQLGKPEGKKPMKHRYVAGYHRGVELYGAQAQRLNEDYVRDSLAQRGVVVVEGMNEVLRMETLQVAAVGLGSNRATDHQVRKLVRFAREVGGNKIVLLPDCDEEGEAGFSELLWKLAEQRVQVRLGCSSAMFDGVFANRQPEDFTDEEWRQIDAELGQQNQHAM